MIRGIVGVVLPLYTEAKEPHLRPVYQGNIPEIASLARIVWIQFMTSYSVIGYFLGNWKTA